MQLSSRQFLTNFFLIIWWNFHNSSLPISTDTTGCCMDHYLQATGGEMYRLLLLSACWNILSLAWDSKDTPRSPCALGHICMPQRRYAQQLQPILWQCYLTSAEQAGQPKMHLRIASTCPRWRRKRLEFKVPTKQTCNSRSRTEDFRTLLGFQKAIHSIVKKLETVTS